MRIAWWSSPRFRGRRGVCAVEEMDVVESRSSWSERMSEGMSFNGLVVTAFHA